MVARDVHNKEHLVHRRNGMGQTTREVAVENCWAIEIEAPFYFVGYNPRLSKWGVFLSVEGRCLKWHSSQDAAVTDAIHRTSALANRPGI